MTFDDETIDVLIGGYLSNDAAQDDYEAVLASGGYLHGAVVVSKDLKGNLSVEQTDHMVREGAAGLGAVGFAVGLFAPPLLAATAVGAVIGAGAGKLLHRRTAKQTRGAGRGHHPGRRCRPDRRLPALGGRQGRTRRDPRHPESRRRSRGPPRAGPQGRDRRRTAEDGRKRRLTLDGGLSCDPASPVHPPDRRRTEPGKITCKGDRRSSQVTRSALARDLARLHTGAPGGWPYPARARSAGVTAASWWRRYPG